MVKTIDREASSRRRRLRRRLPSTIRRRCHRREREASWIEPASSMGAQAAAAGFPVGLGGASDPRRCHRPLAVGLFTASTTPKSARNQRDELTRRLPGTIAPRTSGASAIDPARSGQDAHRD
jgi:hypothetical protein